MYFIMKVAITQEKFIDENFSPTLFYLTLILWEFD